MRAIVIANYGIKQVSRTVCYLNESIQKSFKQCVVLRACSYSEDESIMGNGEKDMIAKIRWYFKQLIDAEFVDHCLIQATFVYCYCFCEEFINVFVVRISI